jgi:hypothetical protein
MCSNKLPGAIKILFERMKCGNTVLFSNVHGQPPARTLFAWLISTR